MENEGVNWTNNNEIQIFLKQFLNSYLQVFLMVTMHLNHLVIFFK